MVPYGLSGRGLCARLIVILWRRRRIRLIVILSRQAKNLVSCILYYVLLEILRFAQDDNA